MDIHTNIKDSLPTDPKLAEPFLREYSRFFATPSSTYFYNTTLQSQKKKLQSLADLASINPEFSFYSLRNLTQSSWRFLAFLTGSTPEMASSPDFCEALKKTFNLKALGMKWNSVNIKNAPKNSSWRDCQALQIIATECREQDTVKNMYKQYLFIRHFLFIFDSLIRLQWVFATK